MQTALEKKAGAVYQLQGMRSEKPSTKTLRYRVSHIVVIRK
jgi:hypothetical protein